MTVPSRGMSDEAQNRNYEYLSKVCDSTYATCSQSVRGGGKLTDCIYGLSNRIWNRSFSNLPDVKESETLLTMFSPDPHTSCIRANLITKQSDCDLLIIVPMYNVEKYINQCIDSILAQDTICSYKVVIVNDGSTDMSRENVKQYENVANVLIIDQENRGLSGARNRALESISSKYIMFVDSDDILPQGAIQALMSKANVTDSDIVQGNYMALIDGKLKKKRNLNESNSADPDSLPGFAWGKVYKSELWNNLIFPEKYWYEDTLNAIVLHKKTQKVTIISDIVYYYRRNKFGITSISRGKPKSIDTFYVTRALFEDVRKLGMFSGSIKRRLQANFFKQCLIGYARTVWLDEDVRKALFVMWKDLYMKLYDQYEAPQNIKHHQLAKTFYDGDYKKYCKICFMSM